jgi:hypothetical protein
MNIWQQSTKPLGRLSLYVVSVTRLGNAGGRPVLGANAITPIADVLSADDLRTISEIL